MKTYGPDGLLRICLSKMPRKLYNRPIVYFRPIYLLYISSGVTSR